MEYDLIVSCSVKNEENNDETTQLIGFNEPTNTINLEQRIEGNSKKHTWCQI